MGNKVKMYRVLYIYPVEEGYNNRKGLSHSRLAHINRLISKGFDIKPYGMQAHPRLNFYQVDALWKFRSASLFKLYYDILSNLEGCDVLYNSTGLIIHPSFLETLKQITVLGFNDDPESSNGFSKPMARYYDLCAIGNIAEVDKYYDWGAKKVIWQPMGVLDSEYDIQLRPSDIDFNARQVDLVMIIDKLSRQRRERMVEIEKAFPHGHFYGRGWKRGYLKEGIEVELLQQSRIGLNFHNSTGPINRRTFYLPANGVMQICDNRSHLGRIFELGKEVIGFDTIQECIDLTRYYISHLDEANEIAINGWQRVTTDYNETTIFVRLLREIEEIEILKDSLTTNFAERSSIVGSLVADAYINTLSKYSSARKKFYSFFFS